MNKQTSAFIAIVGRPNVGKSSILNRIVGEKIAIVTNKPQTTRTRITGIVTLGDMQLVFVDTPGLHKPKNVLGESMIKSVYEGMTGVDCCVLTVDATKKISSAELELIEKFKKMKVPAVLAVNKTDLLEKKETLLKTISDHCSVFNFAAAVPVSAKTGDNIGALRDELCKFAKPSPHFFDDESFTDQPERVLASEIIREKLMLMLDDEVPHGLAVDIEKFGERENGMLDISASIYCEKQSHKGIVIGKNGAKLKAVGTAARHELEKFFETRVNLQLWVKVKENWRDRQSAVRSFGLD